MVNRCMVVFSAVIICVCLPGGVLFSESLPIPQVWLDATTMPVEQPPEPSKVGELPSGGELQLDFLQDQDQSRPYLQPDALGQGLPGLVFDGADDSLYSDQSIDIGGPFSLFLVLQNHHRQHTAVLSLIDEAGGEEAFAVQWQYPLTEAQAHFRAYYGGATPGGAAALNGVPITGRTFIAHLQYRPQHKPPVMLYINGKRIGIQRSHGYNRGSVLANSKIYIGTRGPQGSHFAGAIGEMMIYSSGLSMEQRRQIGSYLAEKWQVTDYQSQLPDLESVTMVADDASVNIHSSLVEYSGRMWLAYRAARRPELEARAPIRIKQSSDGERWFQVRRISDNGVSLCYPRWQVLVDGRLLLALGVYDQGQWSTRGYYTNDGYGYSRPRVLDSANRFSGFSSGMNQTVASGYGERNPQLYISYNGQTFNPVGFPWGYSGAASAVSYYDGPRLVALLYREGNRNTLLGRAASVSQNWVFRDTRRRLEDPHMLLLPNGRVMAVATHDQRNRKRIELFEVFPDSWELRSIMVLPASGNIGGSSLMWAQQRLWLSYHSTHQGQYRIYLAKIAF